MIKLYSVVCFMHKHENGKKKYIKKHEKEVQFWRVLPPPAHYDRSTPKTWWWNGTRSHVLHPVSQYCFIRKSIFPMIMASFLQKNLVPILNRISNFQQQSFCFVLACIHQTYSLRFQYCFLRNNSFSNILIDD